MRNLTSITVIRPAQAISQKRIDQFGFHTHPKNLVSNRYRKWAGMCKNKEYDLLEENIREFLHSSEAITTYQQLPESFQSLVEWAEYEGFEFDLETLASRINTKEISNVFGKEIKEGLVDPESAYFKVRTNLSDQLVGGVVTGRENTMELDIPNTLKTVDLIKDLYVLGSKNLKLDLRRHYDKPVVVDICLFDLLKCRHTLKPKPEIGDDGTVEEKKCRCQEASQKDPCECKCNDDCVDQNPCCADITPYMGELFIVKDELVCYEPGEMSYIENVMQSEIRERTHRHLQREETYTETEEEVNTYEERDQQVEERFSLQKEIDKVVEQDIGANAGVTYSKGSSIGNGQAGLVISSNLNAYANASYKQARRDAKRTVQDHSKNVITRAISRVEKKLRTFNSVRQINEIEDITSHAFKNDGDNAVDISRQFFFVNQVRKGQVYSYGYRMMLDFMIFEPSELLKKLLEDGFDMKKPEKPCVDIEGIDPTDYLKYIQCYGFLDLEAPPKQRKVKYESFTMKKDSPPDQLIVPEGYTATKVEYAGGHANRSNALDDSRISITVGTAQISRYWKDSVTTDPQSMNGTGTLPVIVSYDNINDQASLTVKVTLTPDPVDYLAWQKDVYNRIIKKYQEELAAYENAKAEYERRKQDKFNQNPFLLSNMMKKQLKQAAINYISCQFFDKNDAIKNRVKPCGFPQMDLQEAKREGEFVRFFEQAFEWHFMNYMLYPYFYARKCSWADKLREEAPNGLFTEFLQAGAARLSIPVSPDFEGFVTTYLLNRQLNPYNIPLIPQNLVPIHEEIKEMKQNFHTDRDGHVIHDTSVLNTLGTDKFLTDNQIFLRNNTDYFVSSAFDQTEADKDKDREIFINCNRYRIMSITYDTTIGEIILTMDRPFDEDQDKAWDWSTGAVFVGAAWKFKVPTKLVWLREKGGCLPCYPIECE
jgi:hypothetical protein